MAFNNVIGRIFVAITRLRERKIRIDYIDVNPRIFHQLKNIIVNRTDCVVVSDGPAHLHYETAHGDFIKVKTDKWEMDERNKDFFTTVISGSGERYFVYDFIIKLK